jgi:hypothetical protein
VTRVVRPAAALIGGDPLPDPALDRPRNQQMSNSQLPQKQRKDELRLKIELDFWMAVVAAWLLLGLFG